MPHEVHIVSASKPEFDVEAIKVGRQHRFIPRTRLEEPRAIALHIRVNVENIIESSS